MDIKEINNKEIWENFLEQCQEKTFLDSWNWGEFNQKMGFNIWRLGAYENGELLGVALAIKISARRGTFLFAPHAPAVALAKEGAPAIKYEILKTLLVELKRIAKQEKAAFIRIAPIWPARIGYAEGVAGGQRNEEIFKELKFRQAPIHMHPELTWELDITKSEEELLADMRKTTRYLIRKAQKDGVEVVQSKNMEDIEKFEKLYKETVNRHHFVAFPPDYLKNQFLSLSPDDEILIFLAKYQGEIISSAVIVFWQGTAFYHHGASSQRFAKIPASYYLQWEAIKEAKNRGCAKYNFWGIAPTDDPKHPWAGLSLFKMGFGGYKKEYVKTQDFPLSWKYWFTNIFEILRKANRRL